MKIKDSVEFKKSPPRLWKLIKWFYPEYDPETDLFAFGDTIYIPESRFYNQTEFNVPYDKILHELTHLEQMGFSKLWGVYHFLRCWIDSGFYYKSEIQAYQRQYQYLMGECECGECGAKFLDYLSICFSKFFPDKSKSEIVKDIRGVV